MKRAGTRYAQPELPFVKTSDTSVRAAELAETFASAARATVFLAIAGHHGHGLTDEEGIEETEMSPNTYRPRRVELARAGLIAKHGERPTVSGCKADVWWFPDPEVPRE